MRPHFSKLILFSSTHQHHRAHQPMSPHQPTSSSSSSTYGLTDVTSLANKLTNFISLPLNLWEIDVLCAGCEQCCYTSLQKLPTDQCLPCASGGSAGGVNSSMDTSLVEPRLWRAENQLDAIWFDAQDVNISFILKQLRLSWPHCYSEDGRAMRQRAIQPMDPGGCLDLGALPARLATSWTSHSSKS